MKKLFTFILALMFTMCINAEEYFVVGGCTPSGWADKAHGRSIVQMFKINADEWFWVGRLKVGSGDDGLFKICKSQEGWDNCFYAPSQGTQLSSEWSDMTNDGNDDCKWCVEESGIYLVTINTSTMKIKAEKLTAPSIEGTFFLVGSVEDYYYAAGSNTSEEHADIRLTADLDFTGKPFIPMSSDRIKFEREFDGAGHTIDNAVTTQECEHIGIFRYATNGAYVHDLVLGSGCSFTGRAKVGGIAGFVRGGGTVKLKNVMIAANVTATGDNDANAAGFIGCAEDGTQVIAENCAFTGSVHGQNGQCAAFCGWSQDGSSYTNCWTLADNVYNIEGYKILFRNSAEINNCYYISNNDFSQGTKAAASTLASGELLNLLNTKGTNWYQTVGKDDTPLPFAPSEPTSLTLNPDGFSTFSSTQNAEFVGADAYTATVSGENITLSKIEGSVPANTGVILYSEPSADVSINYVETATATIGSNDLCATSNTTRPTGGFTFVLNGNLFKLYQEGLALAANKAYFHLSHNPVASGAKAMKIVFAEETGINAIQNAKTFDGTAYNLIGQRVNPNAKGIIIKDGMKYLNK